MVDNSQTLGHIMVALDNYSNAGRVEVRLGYFCKAGKKIGQWMWIMCDEICPVCGKNSHTFKAGIGREGDPRDLLGYKEVPCQNDGKVGFVLVDVYPNGTMKLIKQIRDGVVPGDKKE